MAIKKVSQETKKVIRENSVLALPNRPSEKGYTAQQLKEYFTNLVLGDTGSSLAELDRVVQEINDLIGSIEDTTVQKYVVDTVVGKFVEQAPYVSLKFEDNKLKYTKYGTPAISGEIDTVPNDSVFFNSETLKSKSGETIYPKTTSSNVLIGDTNVEKLLLDLQSKLNELEQNHEVDIKTIEDDLSAIVGGDVDAALDSIKELAEALNNNPSSIDDILIQLSNLSTNKVDKISGKGLSTNDYDNTTKAFVDELKSKDVALKTDVKTKLSEMEEDYFHRTVSTEERIFWDGKADGNHTQNISTINGLQKALDNKSDVGHTHTAESLGIDFAGISEQFVSNHNNSSVSHPDIRDEIKEVKNKVDAINNAISFENLAQLTAWFNGTYNRTDGKKPSDLYVGQHIYLRDQDEDDYWVSTIPATLSNLSVLETDKIDLSDYAEKNQLARVAFTGKHSDLDGIPTIPTTLAELAEDDNHKTITKEKLEKIDTIDTKLDKNLGSSEANKMMVTDSSGNIVTAEAGSMAVMVDNLESTSTDMALAANQGRVLDNKKLDKQQGVDNAGKVMAIDTDGVAKPTSGYAKESQIPDISNLASKSYVDNSIANVPTGITKLEQTSIVLNQLEPGAYYCVNPATLSLSSGAKSVYVGAGSTIIAARFYDESMNIYNSNGEINATFNGTTLPVKYEFCDYNGSRYDRIDIVYSYASGNISNHYTKTETDNLVATKASSDLSNVTYPSISTGNTTTGSTDRVIQQYISSDGNTWYRLWASGWKEVGIYKYISGAGLGGSSNVGHGAGHTITLPITFSTTTYNVQMTNVFSTSGSHTLAWDVSQTKTTTSFNCTVVRHGSNSVNNAACYIYVSGY